MSTYIPCFRGVVENPLPLPLVASLTLLGLSACSSGGGDGPVAQAVGSFEIQSISVVSGEVGTELNRPIDVTFNRAIDFSTVTTNTFQVTVSPGQMTRDPEIPGLLLDVGGLPALGEFVLLDESTVRFQPSCPLAGDLSDAGLLRGVEYTFKLPSLPQDGISVAALGDGGTLDAGVTATFKTSNSGFVTDLFADLNAEPPAPVIRKLGTLGSEFTRLEVAGDSASPVILDRVAVGGPGIPPVGFVTPLNLYSDAASRVDVILVIDQPINPSRRNLSAVRLEYLLSSGPDVWQDFPSDIVLERNCGSAGAEIRITPIGPLPQARQTRVVLGATFEDLTGQLIANEMTDFVLFETGVALDPGTLVQGDAADELFEPFTIGGATPGSLEDTRARFDVPTASWNDEQSGALRPSYLFENAGGPGGDFDLVIPGGQDSSFNTTSQTLLGGPGGVPSASQVAIDGVVHVRNLTIETGASWRVRGPNPLTVMASGDVRIEGLIAANGIGAAPVFTLNTANLPQPGAAGVGGGGQGGTASLLTTQSTPRGGAGWGGIDFIPGGGGGGGESGIATTSTNNGENRRPGGGGGGVLGSDTQLINGCANEEYIGLNAEPGHLGASLARGAITNMSPPQGGVRGPGPFSDSRSDNDFWGTMLVGPAGPMRQAIRGELDRPWAGAGGGAGGDATDYPAAIGYPNPSFPLSREDKGAGGGGGGGSITIIALGSISFGPGGRIEANGGTGAGGENTNFINRVGGGSGGGSGGHVVLQSAQSIDFSEVPTASSACVNNFECLSVMALGGQGGAGANNSGGFDPNNSASGNPAVDAKPASTGNGGVECVELPRFCAGGDGGPGVVQLHAPSFADIIPPGGGLDGELRKILRPGPIGMNEQNGVWEGLLVPELGDRSRARSKWIPLGAMRIAPGSSVPEAVEYLFRGIDPATGDVETTNEIVDALPPILSGPLAATGTYPYVENDFTLVFDVSDLAGADDLYRRNPNLMQLFELKLDQGAQVGVFEVVSAEIDEALGEVRLTAGTIPSGARPVDFSLGAEVTLTPRFFGISTDGVDGFLPDSARVSIRFQAAPRGVNGRPDFANASALTSDISDLTNSPANTDFEFFRFVVDFDIAADMTPLSAATPVPSLDFLRVPFRF